MRIERPIAPEPLRDPGKGLLPYIHPPFEAVIFAPLSKLSLLEAYVLWDALSILALIGTLLVLRRRLLIFRREPLWFLQS